MNKGVARCSGDLVGFLHADAVSADDEVVTRVA
jgi:hypothetical protein